jgi:hypothetical protein
MGSVGGMCDGFSIVGASAYCLRTGETDTITVRFAPTAAGADSCSISVGPGGVSTLKCTGFCDMGPACQVTPRSLEFGVVALGDAVDCSFVIANVGGGTLSGTVGASGVWSIVGSSGYSLRAGQSTVVTVRCAPTQAGRLSGEVESGSSNCGTLHCSGSAADFYVSRAELAGGTYSVTYVHGVPAAEEAWFRAMTARFDRVQRRLALTFQDGSNLTLNCTSRPATMWKRDCFTLGSYVKSEVVDLSPAPLTLGSVRLSTPLIYAKCSSTRMILSSLLEEGGPSIVFDHQQWAGRGPVGLVCQERDPDQ